MIRIWVDFNHADPEGRLLLDAKRTVTDIQKHQASLHEGMSVELFSDDDADEVGNPQELSVIGRLQYATQFKCWTALIDWHHIQTIKAKANTHDVDEYAYGKAV